MSSHLPPYLSESVDRTGVRRKGLCPPKMEPTTILDGNTCPRQAGVFVRGQYTDPLTGILTNHEIPFVSQHYDNVESWIK